MPQCPSCQFHNLPGTAACGRCASPIGATAVDVQPPRATKWAKRWRSLTPRRTLYAAREAVADHTAPFVPYTDRLPPGPVLARMVVPGWPQWQAGQRWQAQLMFWSYLACLLPGLLLFGTTAGSMLVGSAFSVHAWSAVDVVNQTFVDRSFRSQLNRSLGVSLGLGLLLYWPAGWLLTWVVTPVTLGYSSGVFSAGDVLLSCPIAEVRPGRAVMYTQDDLSMRRLEGHNYRLFTGERIDRVLAGPGDEAVYKGGRLTVNGIDVPWRPLDPTVRVSDFNCRVPPDAVLIVPSTTADLLAINHTSVNDRMIVPRTAVHAVVYARSSPLRKWMWLN